MNNRPIGIFDSGVGGLTVLRAVSKILPRENIIYFGDTARVPYGNKSKSTIVKFSTENILFLLRKKVKMVIVACNTASALALDYLQGIFNVPIIGVIEAGAARALQVSRNKEIGIIGTRSTMSSGSYEKEILKRDKAAKIYTKACPLFVPFVEEGIVKGKTIKSIVEMYLSDFNKRNIDVIVLGCTHYPLLKNEIAQYLKGVHIVDSATEVALHAKSILSEHNSLCRERKSGLHEFYVTDEPKGFMKLAKLFLKRNINKPGVVNV